MTINLFEQILKFCEMPTKCGVNLLHTTVGNIKNISEHVLKTFGSRLLVTRDCQVKYSYTTCLQEVLKTSYDW